MVENEADIAEAVAEGEKATSSRRAASRVSAVGHVMGRFGAEPRKVKIIRVLESCCETRPRKRCWPPSESVRSTFQLVSELSCDAQLLLLFLPQGLLVPLPMLLGMLRCAQTSHGSMPL